MADYVSTFPVSSLYMFPTYRTRAEIKEKLGIDPPPFDPSKPGKNWVDMNPSKVFGKLALYDFVLEYEAGTSKPAIDADGTPRTTTLALTVAEAKSFNMPHDSDPNRPDDRNEISVPVPMRPLAANEVLVVSGMGAFMVDVKRVDVVADDQGVGFTAYDRALLQKIAQRIGVE